jgi:hypothetical protein
VVGKLGCRNHARTRHLAPAELEAFDPESRSAGNERRFCCPLVTCAAKPRDRDPRSLSMDLATGASHCHRRGPSGMLRDAWGRTNLNLRPSSTEKSATDE